MNSRTRFVGVAWCCLSVLVGCESAEPRVRPDVDERSALAVEDGVLFLDHHEPYAYLLDLTSKEPTARAIALGEGDRRSLVRPPASRGEAVVLTSGVAAEKVDGKVRDEVPAYLSVVGKKGQLRRYELPQRFRELTLSEDGRYAVAYRAQDFSVGPTIAIVDLEAKPSERNPVAKSLDSMTSAKPLRFLFSEEQMIAGEKRRLMLSLLENNVQIVDLDHLERPALKVELSLPSEARTLIPEQVLFDGSEIYVQTGGTEVLVIQLAASSGREFPSGFRPSLLTLPTDAKIRGIALSGEGEDRRLIALTAGQMVVLDPITGLGEPVELQGTYESVLRFEAGSPNDDAERERLLLLGRGSSVAFVDGTDANTLAFGGVEELDVGAPITSFFPLLERNQVIVSHDLSGVTLIDLEQRTIAPLVLPSDARQVLLDAEHERLWISFSDERIGTLALGSSLVAKELLLDEPAQQLVIVGGKRAQVVAVHDSDAGFATVFDAERPTRADARALLGFFWNGLLD